MAALELFVVESNCSWSIVFIKHSIATGEYSNLLYTRLLKIFSFLVRLLMFSLKHMYKHINPAPWAI